MAQQRNHPQHVPPRGIRILIELDTTYDEAVKLFASWIAEAKIRGVLKDSYSNIPVTVCKTVAPDPDWTPRKVPRRPAA
jgi:hypothetical protein